MHRFHSSAILLLAVLSLCSTVPAQQTSPSAAQFRLQDGDTVVFYGDSITEQKLYTSDIENFVLTRFPGRRIRFIHSGVGGDKVSGGWAGPVDLRLARDVFASDRLFCSPSFILIVHRIRSNSPYFTLRYDAHINVELCISPTAAEYLFKYVNKGPDCAIAKAGYDECEDYINYRSIGASEAAWRLFQFDITERYPAVIALRIHLPDEQYVMFEEGAERKLLLNLQNTRN